MQMAIKERLLEQIQDCKDKLNNPKFVANAKPEVVEKEKQKLHDFQHKLDVLESPMSFMVGDTKFMVKRMV